MLVLVRHLFAGFKMESSGEMFPTSNLGFYRKNNFNYCNCTKSLKHSHPPGKTLFALLRSNEEHIFPIFLTVQPKSTRKCSEILSSFRRRCPSEVRLPSFFLAIASPLHVTRPKSLHSCIWKTNTLSSRIALAIPRNVDMCAALGIGMEKDAPFTLIIKLPLQEMNGKI